MPVLTIAATLAGLGLVVVLASAVLRQRRPADLLFAGFLVCVGAQMAGNVLLATAVIQRVPHAAQLHTPLAFALGPLLFAYVRGLAGRPLPPRALLLHLTPALAVALWLVPFYFQSAADKTAFLSSALAAYPQAWRVRQVVLIAQLGLYVLATLQLRRAALARTPRAARWVQPLLVALPVIWAVTLVRFVLAYDAQTATLSTMMLAVVIGFVLASSVALPAGRPVEPLADRDAIVCLDRANQVMAQQEIFRDRQLTLESLAHHIGTTPHVLSRAVNEGCGRTFPDWLNGHRVAAVKRALEDPSRTSEPIQDVAAGCGFSSRTTFNAAFKRETGTTPGEFRRGRRPAL